MDTPLKIALVEDNDDLRDLLFRDIAKARYAVQSAGCADDLDDLTAMMSFDVLVLDVNLPGENGFEIAQRYKQSNSSIYVIMLTARGDPDDKISGYNSGADIYLTKPVGSAELLAAIGSVHRRIQRLQFPGSVVDLNLKEMTLKRDTTVLLNRQEVVILKALSESTNGKLPYYRLLELCGEEVSVTSKATLEVRIVRLRKKMAEIGVEGKPIRAIRGEGYQLIGRINII